MLEQIARNTDRTVSQIIRMLVRQYLETPTQENANA